MRLDKYLVEVKKIESRSIAQSLIKNNNIKVNGNVLNKSNYIVKENDNIEILGENKYVSRAAYKLLKAIETFNIVLEDKVIVDIGSSTGGFVQVCLENKCNYIYAIDVGTNQLHKSLRNINNIKILENTNFRYIDNNLIDKKIDFITCDVSFISSKLILEKILNLFNYKIEAIFLLKPQFEAGKEIISKHDGYVPEKYHKKIIDDYISFCNEKKIKVLAMVESPILGSKLNNKEYLIHLEINYEK